jgi:hypothetical protein
MSALGFPPWTKRPTQAIVIMVAGLSAHCAREVVAQQSNISCARSILAAFEMSLRRAIPGNSRQTISRVAEKGAMNLINSSPDDRASCTRRSRAAAWYIWVYLGVFGCIWYFQPRFSWRRFSWRPAASPVRRRCRSRKPMRPPIEHQRTRLRTNTPALPSERQQNSCPLSDVLYRTAFARNPAPRMRTRGWVREAGLLASRLWAQ